MSSFALKLLILLLATFSVSFGQNGTCTDTETDCVPYFGENYCCASLNMNEDTAKEVVGYYCASRLQIEENNGVFSINYLEGTAECWAWMGVQASEALLMGLLVLNL